MQMKSISIVVVLLLAVGVGSYVLFFHKVKKGIRSDGQAAVDSIAQGSSNDSVSWVTVDQDGKEGVVIAIGDAAIDDSQRIISSSSLRDSFQQSLEGLLQAYLSDSYTDLKAYMVEHDIEPPDSFINDPKRAQQSWNDWMRMVADAKFDTQNIRVIRGHQAIKNAPVGKTNEEAVREGATPTLPPKMLPNLEHIEVHIPGIYHSPFTDDTFQGTLGLEFVRSKDKKWVLYRTSWFDVPVGIPTVAAPL